MGQRIHQKTLSVISFVSIVWTITAGIGCEAPNTTKLASESLSKIEKYIF